MRQFKTSSQWAPAVSLVLLGLMLTGFVHAQEAFVQTRVFCLDSELISTGLRTISTGTTPNAPLRTLFFETSGTPGLKVSDQIPLWSDAGLTENLLISESPILGGDSRVYLAASPYTEARGTLREVARFPSLAWVRDTWPALGLRGGHVAVDETKTLLVLPSASGQSYDLIDFRTKTKLRSIQMSPLIWSNPLISMDAGAVVFQKISDRERVRLQLWNLKTDQSETLPVVGRGSHQLSPQFVSGRLLTWLEWTSSDAIVWMLDMTTRQSRVVARLMLPHSPQLAAGWLGELTFVVPFERRTSLSQGTMLEGGLTVIRLDPVSLNLKSLSGVDFPMSEQTRKLSDLQPRLFTSLSWSPWTAEFVLGKGGMGGLVSWNPNTGFKFIGPQNRTARCLNPKLAPEYIGAW